MSRVTDEQIKAWREFAGPDDYGHGGSPFGEPCGTVDEPCDGCESDARVAATVTAILDALESERSRADAAELHGIKTAAHYIGKWARSEKLRGRLIETLWNSRRMIQDQLAEARAWAAWFAAKAEWLDHDIRVIVERDQARARVAVLEGVVADQINPANLNYRWKGHPVL